MHRLPERLSPGRSGMRARSRGLGIVAVLTLLTLHLAAADSVSFKTNYYEVIGATLAEVRESIVRSRPWNTNSVMDGRTDWKVRWRFKIADYGNVALVQSFEVLTTVTVTLPTWNPPADVPQPLLEGWKRYFGNLKRHEDGHVALALRAAAEVRKRTSVIKEAPTLRELTDQINNTANKAIDEFRRKDQEYDKVTQHGVRQDAWLP